MRVNVSSIAEPDDCMWMGSAVYSAGVINQIMQFTCNLFQDSLDRAQVGVSLSLRKENTNPDPNHFRLG
jgi:hypothetical protein